MIDITEQEWDEIPEGWKTGRHRETLAKDSDWVYVRIANSILPYGAVRGKYWDNRHAATTEVTIAVWADGSFGPITETPEEHVLEAHDRGAAPAHYQIWERHATSYSLKNKRFVEMRPVVLP